MLTDDRIDDLSEDRVFEVARMVLADRVNVSEPDEALDRAAEALGLPMDGRAELREEAELAARQDSAELADALKLVLKDASQEDPEKVARSIDDAGRRQTVIGIDMMALGALLLIAYVVAEGRGRESTETIVKVERDSKGNVTVTSHEKTVYINPLSALGKMLLKAVGIPSNDA